MEEKPCDGKVLASGVLAIFGRVCGLETLWIGGKRQK